MVIKTLKAIKEVDERHKFCDVCGKELDMNLACYSAKCMYCGKDLCEEHIGHEEDTSGDYRVVYCENCWQLGELYRPRIEKLQNEVARLYKRWQDDCRKVILKS